MVGCKLSLHSGTAVLRQLKLIIVKEPKNFKVLSLHLWNGEVFKRDY